jgi:methanogenic corrinoid protein MtbC1
MNSDVDGRALTLSIAAVERDTGLSKDTLRIWERRYGFPTPERDPRGERAYPLAQVEKLRLVKRLMDAGHRPGRVVALPTDTLQRLLAQAESPPPSGLGLPPELRAGLDRVRAHDVEGLRQWLSQRLLRVGLGRFVVEVIAPMNTLIGDSWMRGHLEVFEEHLYTESVQVVLRHAMQSLAIREGAAGSPCVVMTTLPNEPHGMGLLMAEALLLLEGARCLSLGVQTPLWDLSLAATALRADIVALSFTSVMAPNAVAEDLAALRRHLPEPVEIWAGGSAPVLHRRRLDGVVPLASLAAIAGQVRRWRAARA